MLIKTNFSVNSNRQETPPMKQQGMQYVCLVTETENFRGGIFPWHWHSGFEIDYMDKGEVDLQTPEHTIRISQGDAVFINSGVLHSYHTTGNEDFRIYAHIFEAGFLGGQFNERIESNYILPILNCGGLECYHIRSDRFSGIQMLSKIVEITELLRDEPYGFEFDVRHVLSLFWRLLLSETEDIRMHAKVRRNSDAERMKQMMGFIHEHYAEDVTLDEIAAAGSIGKRECIRCFQRSIDVTPINYLNSYRIRVAAQLLTGTSDSVTFISESCGFSSPSYFGKVFRETLGVTPKQYRMQGTADKKS